jgi:hypothetical protein
MVNVDKLEILNRRIEIYKSSELIKMHINKPNEQRIINNNKVNEIIEYQLNYLKKYKHTNFLGVINIHYCNENSEYYLVDGQHRYTAIKELLHKYSHDIDICIEIVKVNTKDELKENYKLINKNTPLPEFPKTIDKNIPEKAAQYFQEKYPHMWSKNSRARRPHIYFNFFQETLAIITNEISIIDNANKLINIIEEYNTLLSTHHPDDIVKTYSVKMYDTAKKWDFYLGLFTHSSNDDYGYYWARNIITYHTGKKIKKNKIQTSKQNIPKKVKNDSWDKYIGNKYGEALCIVCRVTSINAKDFEAGHIISEKNGGLINIDNILPICSQCNKSMGSKNMDEYIKNNYPKNYENFKKRSYKNNNSWFKI